jgi:hypothetical protein
LRRGVFHGHVPLVRDGGSFFIRGGRGDGEGQLVSQGQTQLLMAERAPSARAPGRPSAGGRILRGIPEIQLPRPPCAAASGGCADAPAVASLRGEPRPPGRLLPAATAGVVDGAIPAPRPALPIQAPTGTGPARLPSLSFAFPSGFAELDSTARNLRQCQDAPDSDETDKKRAPKWCPFKVEVVNYAAFRRAFQLAKATPTMIKPAVHVPASGTGRPICLASIT